MRFLSAKLIFLLLIFLSVCAQALDSQICIRGFARLTAGDATFARGLHLGDPIQLKIGGIDGTINTVFIGKMQGAQGTETILANLEDGVRYHVPDSWVSWKTLKQDKAPKPTTSHWYAQTEKNHDGTCMAHSAADCIIDIGQTLKALSDPNEAAFIRSEREAIYNRFRPLLYSDTNQVNGFNQAEEFLRAMQREGFGVRPRSSTQALAADEVLQHLSTNKPVLITYDAEFREVVRAEGKAGLGVADSLGDNSFRLRVPAPAKDGEQIGAHAILALGVFDVPGFGKFVVVHDSSRRGLQVMKWSEIAESHGKNPIRYYLVDSKPVAKTDGFEELAKDLRAQNNPKLAEEITQSPENFVEVPGSMLVEKLTSSELIGSTVIVKRKAHGLSRTETPVVLGKVVSAVTNGDGKSKLVGFSTVDAKGKSTTVYLNSDRIDSLYVYKPVSMKSNSLSELIGQTDARIPNPNRPPPVNPVRSLRQLTSSSEIGDSVMLKYRSTLGGEDRYISGTIVMVDKSRGNFTIRNSQIPHELVPFSPDNFVSSAFTSSIPMRPLKFDGAARFQKMASTKNVANFALVSLKTRDGAAVEVYGSIAFSNVTENAFRMTVTDSKGVTHTIDSGQIESMTAQFTPKSEETRSLFYFEHPKPLSLLEN